MENGKFVEQARRATYKVLMPASKRVERAWVNSSVESGRHIGVPGPPEHSAARHILMIAKF